VSEVKKNKNEDLKVGFRKALLFPNPTSLLFDEGDNIHPYFLMWGIIHTPSPFLPCKQNDGFRSLPQ
jgi:hypothetical protein